MAFKTQAEIYQHLLSGGSISSDHTEGKLYLKEGTQFDGTCKRNYGFNNPERWQPAEELKKIVAHVEDDGDIYLSIEDSDACKERDKTTGFYKRVNVNLSTMEIE